MLPRHIVIKLPDMPNPHYAALLYAAWGAVVAAGLDEEASCEHDGQISDGEVRALFAEASAHSWPGPLPSGAQSI
jgi:hypothetical protein